MAQLLKTKNINVILGQSSCRQCKAKFLLEKCNLLSVTYTNNESTECQTPRKKLNTSLKSIGISAVSLHTVPQHSRMTTVKLKLDEQFKE